MVVRFPRLRARIGAVRRLQQAGLEEESPCPPSERGALRRQVEGAFCQRSRFVAAAFSFRDSAFRRQVPAFPVKASSFSRRHEFASVVQATASPTEPYSYTKPPAPHKKEKSPQRRLCSEPCAYSLLVSRSRPITAYSFCENRPITGYSAISRVKISAGVRARLLDACPSRSRARRPTRSRVFDARRFPSRSWNPRAPSTFRPTASPGVDRMAVKLMQSTMLPRHCRSAARCDWRARTRRDSTSAWPHGGSPAGLMHTGSCEPASRRTLGTWFTSVSHSQCCPMQPRCTTSRAAMIDPRSAGQ
jgi:hypothetical protein